MMFLFGYSLKILLSGGGSTFGEGIKICWRESTVGMFPSGGEMSKFLAGWGTPNPCPAGKTLP